MNDEMIVQLYLNRNESAIKETSVKFGRRLQQISFNIVKNPSDAEECENNTYFSAWNSIPPHSPKNYLFAFLAKITRNLSLNLYKKNTSQKRNATLVELTDEMEQCLSSLSDTSCTIEDKEFIVIINNFLHGLKEDECKVFLRRYWFFDSIAQISRRFAMSESKVKSMLFRTRNKLRKYLEMEGYNI